MVVLSNDDGQWSISSGFSVWISPSEDLPIGMGSIVIMGSNEKRTNFVGSHSEGVNIALFHSFTT